MPATRSVSWFDGWWRTLPAIVERCTERAARCTVRFAGSGSAWSPPARTSRPAARALRPRAAGCGPPRRRRRRLAAPSGILSLLFFVAVGPRRHGARRQYETFVAMQGDPRDLVARAIGLRHLCKCISGMSELDHSEVLRPPASIRGFTAFLDAAEVRERLLSVPLIKEPPSASSTPTRSSITSRARTLSRCGSRTARSTSCRSTARSSTRCATALRPSAAGRGRGRQHAMPRTFCARQGRPRGACTCPRRYAGRRSPLDLKHRQRRRGQLPEEGAADAALRRLAALSATARSSTRTCWPSICASPTAS